MPFTPGGIVDIDFSLGSSEPIEVLTFNFSLDALPPGTERYYWALQFYLDDASGGNGQGGYFGFQNNGNLITANDVGGIVNFALWDATSGAAGPEGEAGSFGGEGVGYRTPSAFTMSAGHEYTFKLSKLGDTVRLDVIDTTTSESLLIGAINCMPGRHIANYFIAFSEIYTDVPSAASMSFANAHWTDFGINGNPVDISWHGNSPYHDPRVIANGVNWSYTFNDNSLAIASGGGPGDVIYGTALQDEFWAGGAGSQIVALAGDDTLHGGAGADLLNGGDGNDELDGAAGADALIGGLGNDLYRVDNAGDSATEDVNAGTDTVTATRSWAVSSNIERVYLQGTGDFNIAGNGLANILKGNSGDNWLNGSFGKDTLTGGGGRDSFIFNRTLGPNNIDTITDYDVIRDVIRIDNAVFAGIGPAGALAAGMFNTGASATQADDRIIYDQTTGKLFFDIDGVGGAAQIHFATLSIKPTGMSASEFIII